MLKSMFARKDLEKLRAEAEVDRGFKRVLTTWDLTILGVGLVIGTGIFVLTGHVAALNAGPAVGISFALAAIPAALAAFCYAEMVSTVPAEGGAYTYVSTALGELPGFLVGWTLILAYLVGAATVATGWSAYACSLYLQLSGSPAPEAWVQAPVRVDAATQALHRSGNMADLPAAAIILLMSGVLLLGAQRAMRLAKKLVALKIGVVLLFLVTAVRFIQTKNWLPFVPENTGTFGHFGVSGIFQGASLAVFAYLGVDNLSTAVQEARDPQHSVPRAIGITMLFSTLLYILVCMVLTGVVPYQDLGVADPIIAGIAATGSAWLRLAVQVGSIAGLTSVLMMQIYGLPRILYAMARDGFAPAWAGQLSSKSSTPHVSTLVMGIVCAVGAALLPIELLGELTSVGTLLTFIAVSLGVAVLRKLHPRARRRFRVPGGPYVVPACSALGSLALFVIAPPRILLMLATWLMAGGVIYGVCRKQQAQKLALSSAAAPR